MNDSFELSPPLTTKEPQAETKPSFLKGEALDRYLAKKAENFAAIGLLRRYNEEWFMFDGTVYHHLLESAFYHFAYQCAFSDNVILKSAHCRKLLAETMIRTPASLNAPNDESYTVFSNGIFSNSDGRMISIPSDYFATISVNGHYLPQKTLYHPVADAFLTTISGGDPELIARHWEFWGYILSSDARAKAIFMLFGATGNNGKSTELTLLSNLLSPGGADTMPLSTMLSRFGIHRIRNCRLEYSGDEGAMNLNSTQIALLKAMSGHDGMTADVKNKEMVQFVCTCKIAISSNYNIGMAYSAVDPAFARRLRTIPYPVSIPREQQDPYIITRLLEERDAIVTEAFNRYLELRARNYQFTGSAQFDAASAILFAPISPEYNAIRDFSQTFCDFTDQSAFTTTQALFEAFTANYQTNICDTTGFSQAFRLVNQDKIQSKRQHTSNYNLRGFTGVKLLMP